MKGNTLHRFFSIAFSRKDRTFVSFFFFSERSPFAIRFLGKIESLAGLFIFTWVFSSLFYYRKRRRSDDFNIFHRWMHTFLWQACTWRKIERGIEKIGFYVVEKYLRDRSSLGKIEGPFEKNLFRIVVRILVYKKLMWPRATKEMMNNLRLSFWPLISSRVGGQWNLLFSSTSRKYRTQQQVCIEQGGSMELCSVGCGFLARYFPWSGRSLRSERRTWWS